MKLTRSQLRYLIKEIVEVKGIKTGVKNPEGGLDFIEGGPDDDYGVIAKAFEDKKKIEDQLANSLVDVNFIIVPEQVLKDLSSYVLTFDPNLFSTDIDTGVMSRLGQSAAAAIKGQTKMLNDLRKQYDPEAFNIIVQRVEKDNLGFRIDVPWMIHDTVGHALNFANYGRLLDPFKDLFVRVFSLGRKTSLTFGITGEFERETGVGTIRDKKYGKPDIEKELMEFFKEKEFTYDANPEDVSASIIGYYFMYAKWPDPIQKAADDGEIDALKLEEMRLELDRIFKTLIGKVSYVNFGPSSSAY